MIYCNHNAKVLNTSIPNSDYWNERLFKIIDNVPDFYNKTTNVKAKMTSFYSHQEYKDFELFDTIVKSIILDSYWKPIDNEELTCFNMWGNVYNRGDYTIKHNHDPFYISFVYFVKTPKGSSPFIFSNSRKKINGENGKLIIFPSYLDHEVPPNKCENRVTVSGNYKIVY